MAAGSSPSEIEAPTRAPTSRRGGGSPRAAPPYQDVHVKHGDHLLLGRYECHARAPMCPYPSHKPYAYEVIYQVQVPLVPPPPSPSSLTVAPSLQVDLQSTQDRLTALKSKPMTPPLP